MEAIIKLDGGCHQAGWRLSSSWMEAIIKLDGGYHQAGWRLSSSWMEAIIKHKHIVVLRHMGGVNHILAALREKYWISHGREAVGTVLQSCVHCQNQSDQSETNSSADGTIVFSLYLLPV